MREALNFVPMEMILSGTRTRKPKCRVPETGVLGKAQMLSVYSFQLAERYRALHRLALRIGALDNR